MSGGLCIIDGSSAVHELLHMWISSLSQMVLNSVFLGRNIPLSNLFPHGPDCVVAEGSDKVHNLTKRGMSVMIATCIA